LNPFGCSCGAIPPQYDSSYLRGRRDKLRCHYRVPVKQNKIHGFTGYKFHGANLFGLLGGAVDIFYVFDEEGTEDRHE